MSEARKDEVTMKGNPVELAGPRLKVGDQVPNFTCVGEGLSLIHLADTPAKPRMFSVVPSLDTPVCNIQTKKIAKEIGELGDRIAAYTVSLDLPFAQNRFCGDPAHKIDNLISLSDYQDRSFGQAYGCLIDELKITSRSIFVVGKDGKLVYVEYVPEVTSEPNYEKALAALKGAV